MRIRPAISWGKPTEKPTTQKFDRSIVEGPVRAAVWRLAWPMMLQNAMSGLQGIVDHSMVGHFVGYQANAAVGVSWGIITVVIVFISSLTTGMGVLVARFAGAGEPEKVSRVVYQAFLTTLAISFGMAALGYFASPALLDAVNAAPEVKALAMPFIRTMFIGIFGMMMFFMLNGAFRSAGDPRTPLRLGMIMTVLTIVLNVLLIPKLGVIGAALGVIISSTAVASYGVWRLFTSRSVIHFHRGMKLRPDWSINRSLFAFGLPTGVQSIAMNVAGVLLLRFIGSMPHSAAAQAAYAVGYSELFSLVTWISIALMGASAIIAGQSLGAGVPDRAIRGVATASRLGVLVAAVIALAFLAFPQQLLGIFGMKDAEVLSIGEQLLRYLSVSALFVPVALCYSAGLQGTGDTRGALYIAVVSQIVVPLGICAALSAKHQLQPGHIWLALVIGHITRALLSVIRFRRGKWRQIATRVQSA